MNPYAHILSPVQVRGKTFKTRLLQSKCSLPPQDTATLADFYVDTARNGAATTATASAQSDSRGGRIQA